MAKSIDVSDLNIYYGDFLAVEGVNMTIRARSVTAFIGPSGCGKSTFLRSLNRMHEVIPGARVEGKDELDAIVEKSLRRAGLWEEVKDRLTDSGTALSGGQQQRLCIARAIAVDPEVILMDEPCSALDPIATAKIEELIADLSGRYAIVIVTHSMQQAARVSQKTAFFHLGNLVEFGETDKIFTSPEDPRTESYITGRIG